VSLLSTEARGSLQNCGTGAGDPVLEWHCKSKGGIDEMIDTH